MKDVRAKRTRMLHEPAERGVNIARTLTLGLALLCACHSTPKSARQPMFVGTPVVSSLRPEIVDLHALGAPKPSVRRLQLAVRVTANGKALGSSSELVGKAVEGYGEYVEEGAYRATDGSCTLTSRNQAVAIGGFLVLMEYAEVWSADCGGGGTTRREAAHMEIVSGELFPLKVGNRVALRYLQLESFEGEPEGTAQQSSPVSAVYEVIERIPDLRTPSGRSVGEVYLIRVTENKRGKQSTFEFSFSTVLGWRVGYKTDLTAVLVDWGQ
jgi:hypothetical protein